MERFTSATWDSTRQSSSLPSGGRSGWDTGSTFSNCASAGEPAAGMLTSFSRSLRGSPRWVQVSSSESVCSSRRGSTSREVSSER